jgi:hypothetical protein
LEVCYFGIWLVFFNRGSLGNPRIVDVEFENWFFNK